MTFKTTVEYNHGDHHWDLGETSLEYLRRLSPDWRILLAIEGGETGAPDEWVLVTAGQWRIAKPLLSQARERVRADVEIHRLGTTSRDSVGAPVARQRTFRTRI